MEWKKKILKRDGWQSVPLHELKDAKVKNCNHIGSSEIICRTTFGQGDSTTKVHAKCNNCGEMGLTLSQWGWPPTKELMREALTSLQEKK